MIALHFVSTLILLVFLLGSIGRLSLSLTTDLFDGEPLREMLLPLFTVRK